MSNKTIARGMSLNQMRKTLQNQGIFNQTVANAVNRQDWYLNNIIEFLIEQGVFAEEDLITFLDNKMQAQKDVNEIDEQKEEKEPLAEASAEGTGTATEGHTEAPEEILQQASSDVQS